MDTKRAIYNFLSRPIYLFSVLSVLFALAAALPPISPNLLGNRWFDTSALELTTVPQTWGFAAALFILWVSNGMVFIKLFFHQDRLRAKRYPGLAIGCLGGLCALLLGVGFAGPALRNAIGWIGVCGAATWPIASVIALAIFWKRDPAHE